MENFSFFVPQTRKVSLGQAHRNCRSIGMKLATVNKEDIQEVSDLINLHYKHEIHTPWHVRTRQESWKIHQNKKKLRKRTRVVLYPYDYSLRVETNDVYGNYICMRKDGTDHKTKVLSTTIQSKKIGSSSTVRYSTYTPTKNPLTENTFNNNATNINPNQNTSTSDGINILLGISTGAGFLVGILLLVTLYFVFKKSKSKKSFY